MCARPHLSQAVASVWIRRLATSIYICASPNSTSSSQQIFRNQKDEDKSILLFMAPTLIQFSQSPRITHSMISKSKFAFSMPHELNRFSLIPALPVKVSKDDDASTHILKEPMHTHNNVMMKAIESVKQQLHGIEDDPKLIGFLSRSCMPYKSNGIKMALVIGLLAFANTQQALANAEFASGTSPLAFFGDLGDISTGFASAFLLIFFSELGDKTFFIAALLAARNSGFITFIGTFGALAVMTVISVVLGRTFHYVDGILPFRFGDGDLPLDDIAAVCLLVYFGVTTLLDAYSGDGQKIDEEQKEAELAVSELSSSGAGIMAAANTVFSTFLLVFVAEWGDKSFFSTIALAAASSPLGVIGGALAGHGLATLLAVIGGSLLGTFFSEKVIAYVGGVLFLVFAVVTLIETVT